MKANLGFILFVLSCILTATYSIRLVAKLGEDCFNLVIYLICLLAMSISLKLIGKGKSDEN